VIFIKRKCGFSGYELNPRFVGYLDVFIMGTKLNSPDATKLNFRFDY
jgi:hypothetical protein